MPPTMRTRYHIIPAQQGTTDKEIKTAKSLYLDGVNAGKYPLVKNLQLRFLDTYNVVYVELQDIATDQFKDIIKFSPIP